MYPINEVVRLKKNLEAAGEKKRGRHPVFNANMFYPRAIENDLQDLLKAELERIFLLNMQAALVGLRDDIADLNAAPVTLSPEFVEKTSLIATRVNEHAGQAYQKQVDMIIGRPYYPPGAQREILEAWHSEFQTLCISAGQDGKKKIAMTVAVAKEKGWNKLQTEAAIREILPAETKHRAELIARTELGKLNTRCVLSNYEQTGIKYYKWLTTIDGRERESHALMNGLICSVTDPDVYYDDNPENPLRPIEHKRTGDMVHLHPGQDFQCRCTMVMWEPEIDSAYEVKEDQERAEQERLEQEEKARQEEEEKRRKEQEAEQERKRKEAEEKARAEMERRAREEAERKYQEEKAKAEAAKKTAEAAAKKATSKTENILKAVEKTVKIEQKAYNEAGKAFKETYKNKYRFKGSELSVANFVVNKERFDEDMRKKAAELIEARKKLEKAIENADVVYRANGDISYTVAQYLKKTEKEYQDAYQKIWEHGDERIKKLYTRMINYEMKVSTAKSGFYDPTEKLVNLGKACRLTNKRGVSATLWHEMGHNAHFSLGNPLYARMDDLRAAAKKDLTPFYDLIDQLDKEAIKSGSLRNMYVKMKIFETEMFKDFFAVGDKLGGHDAIFSIFSDIAEGFSEGRVDMYMRGFYGHGRSYWRDYGRTKNNPEEEFFAEMCEAYMRPEIKNTLKKYIPNMIGIFEEVLNSVQ